MHRVFQRLFDRRANVALIIALSAPLLIAVTGLGTDVGYWYQQQTTLQSAADAAALAAAMSDSRLAQTTASAKQSAALPVASAAADASTNDKFGFVAGTGGSSLTLTASIPTSSSGSSEVSYTATATIHRSDFFSHVAGLGFTGLTSGFQSAGATAILKTTTTSSPGGCLAALGQNGTGITATGGASITATNCGIVSNSTASCSNSGSKGGTGSIAVNPSASITGQTISAAGCINVDSNGGAKLTASNGSAFGTTGETDPFDNAASGNVLGTPPIFPAMILAPAGSTVPPFPALSTVSTPQTSPCGSTSGQAVTVSPCNYASAIGIGGGDNITFTSGSNSSTYGSTYTVLGRTSSGGSTIAVDLTTGLTSGQLDTATYYMTGLSSFANPTTTPATTWALALESPKNTLGGGIFYLNGGMEVDGSNGTPPNGTTIGPGTYLLNAFSGSSNGALFLQDGTTTFSGGTYFINGGLDVGGSATVTFGPGIYYIENGNLTFGNGATVTANDVTFVLENGAGFDIVGGSTGLSLSAPVANSATHPTNCVLPLPSTDATATPYPLSTFSLATQNTTNATNAPTTGTPAPPFPYDGTNGQGICGVLIYQVRGDTAPDTVANGAAATINGIIYTPSAALTLSGTGNISATPNSDGSTGTLAILASSVALTGSGQITISAAPNSPVGGTATTTTQALLTN